MRPSLIAKTPRMTTMTVPPAAAVAIAAAAGDPSHRSGARKPFYEGNGHLIDLNYNAAILLVH